MTPFCTLTLENIWILGVPSNCQFVQGDFMELPFEANTFDHVYVIEAACHAPEKVDESFLSCGIHDQQNIV